MNSNLISIAYWFDADELVLNSDKTNYVMFTLRIKNHQIREPSKQTYCSRYPGIVIDNHLNWKDRMSLITKRYQEHRCLCYD